LEYAHLGDLELCMEAMWTSRGGALPRWIHEHSEIYLKAFIMETLNFALCCEAVTQSLSFHTTAGATQASSRRSWAGNSCKWGRWRGECFLGVCSILLVCLPTEQETWVPVFLSITRTAMVQGTEISAMNTQPHSGRRQRVVGTGVNWWTGCPIQRGSCCWVECVPQLAQFFWSGFLCNFFSNFKCLYVYIICVCVCVRMYVCIFLAARGIELWPLEPCPQSSCF
jgi:hypothetical protein